MQLDCGPCVVRTSRRDDVEALVEIANDWEVARFLRDRFPHPYTRADARDWVERTATEESTHFIIEIDGRVAGGIGYIPRTAEERRTAEIGYWLGRAFHGRGVATAACRALTELAFEEHDLLRVEARPHSNNPASMRVLEKCGFEREGVLRRAIVKAGEILDVAIYAKLRP
jgi:RimJ/RimL family protein N-acetyltransferase